MIPNLPRPDYKHREDMNRYLTVALVMRVNLAISFVNGDAAPGFASLGARFKNLSFVVLS